MRLSILYAADGSILAAARAAAARSAETPAGVPEVTLRPGEGQRLALLEVDPAWEQRPLAELHAAFSVVEGSEGARLQPRAAAS